jgi:prepilin-type processing-associated H-X9-DG protein
MRVDQRGHLMGFLYVDGHVRAYHGERDISSNAYVARRHLAMPASTDYWVNDSSGDPLLVITGEVDAALTTAMPRLAAAIVLWHSRAMRQSITSMAGIEVARDQG